MRFQQLAPPPIYVSSPEEIESCIRHCLTSDLLGADTETLGLLKNPDTGRKYDKMTDQIIVMGLSPDDESRYLVPRRYLHHFKGLLEHPDIPKALSNIKFDAHRFMNTSGIYLQGPWVDTVHLDFLVDEDTRENRHGLKPCAWDYLKIPMREYKELFGTTDPREIVPGHSLWLRYLDYSSLDPWATRRLAKLLMGKLEQIQVWSSHNQGALTQEEMAYTLKDLYWDTEEPQLKALFDMERRGIYIDRPTLEDIEASLQAEMEEVATRLNNLVGYPFKPNSGQQIGKLLFEEKGLTPRGLTPTGNYKTDESVLAFYARGKHQIEECSLILQYKKASKLKGTYARGLLKHVHTDGRIHTKYSATKATGRLGSSEPNLQNVPRPDNDPHGIRSVFVPTEGNIFIVADYGQLEMRIMAFAAYTYGDDTMLNAICGNLNALEGDFEGIEGGLDMHSFTASKMMGIPYKEFIQLKEEGDPTAKALRTAAKSVGFGIIYGITKYKLSEQLSEALGRYVSEDEAQGYIDMYLATFPGVRTYMRETAKHAKQHGYVQTLSGRFRRLSKMRSRNQRERGHAARQAINAPIQGSAADIVKRAMLLVTGDAYLKDELGFLLLHQVHDELIFEGPEEHAEEAAKIIQNYMEHPFKKDLPVPLEAGPLIVRSWAEAK
jgi:DNA polymerase-1